MHQNHFNIEAMQERRNHRLILFRLKSADRPNYSYNGVPRHTVFFIRIRPGNKFLLSRFVDSTLSQ